MRREPTSKLNLFFLECIIGILFFSLASVVILKAFTQADALRVNSKDKVQAMVTTCSVAEYIKLGGPIEVESSSWYYDKNWEWVSKGEEATFMMEMTRQEETYDGGSLQIIHLKVSKQRKSTNKPLWELTFKHYIPSYEFE